MALKRITIGRNIDLPDSCECGYGWLRWVNCADDEYGPGYFEADCRKCNNTYVATPTKYDVDKLTLGSD